VALEALLWREEQLEAGGRVVRPDAWLLRDDGSWLAPRLPCSHRLVHGDEQVRRRPGRVEHEVHLNPQLLPHVPQLDARGPDGRHAERCRGEGEGEGSVLRRPTS
jgi:hypothetical protein